MMKQILLIGLVILSFRGFSQVILTQKDVPPLGTQIVFSNVKDTASLNNFKFSKTGTDNFWDFSTITPNYNDTIKFINPKQTPYYLNFLEADRSFGFGDFYYYFKSEPSGYFQLGYTSYIQPCPFYQPLRHKRPYLLMPFPASYPYLKYDTINMRTENYINNMGDTTYCEEYIYSTKEIIATGIIKLTFGTFESFLLKTSLEVLDTTWVKGKDGKWNSEINVFPGGSDTYNWYCNNSTYSVAQINPSGNGNVEFMFVQMNNYANLKSLIVEDVSSLKTKIYPNPASEKLYIENNLAQNCNYLITNLLGQEVDRGLLKSEIDIIHLLNGVFVLKIVSTNNQIQVFKFIKQ